MDWACQMLRDIQELFNPLKYKYHQNSIRNTHFEMKLFAFICTIGMVLNCVLYDVYATNMEPAHHIWISKNLAQNVKDEIKHLEHSEEINSPKYSGKIVRKIRQANFQPDSTDANKNVTRISAIDEPKLSKSNRATSSYQRNDSENFKWFAMEFEGNCRYMTTSINNFSTIFYNWIFSIFRYEREALVIHSVHCNNLNFLVVNFSVNTETYPHCMRDMNVISRFTDIKFHYDDFVYLLYDIKSKKDMIFAPTQEKQRHPQTMLFITFGAAGFIIMFILSLGVIFAVHQYFIYRTQSKHRYYRRSYFNPEDSPRFMKSSMESMKLPMTPPYRVNIYENTNLKPSDKSSIWISETVVENHKPVSNSSVEDIKQEEKINEQNALILHESQESLDLSISLDEFSFEFEQDNTENEVNENSQVPLSNSTESLGLTRIEYLGDDVMNFRIETDL